ncbi:MAG: class I SAM-dependent methyltransferase [Anaerolineae bacterium]
MIERVWLRAIQYLNAKLKSASMRLTRWTGKSSVYIHPKHLAGLDAGHHWYTEHLEPGDVVLDVGCGSGAHALRAAKRCRLVVGFDYDGRQLATGQQLVARQGVKNLRLLEANAEDGFPFAEGTFDQVLFLDVLEHLRRRQAALREIGRVLRDGGTVFLAAPNRETSWKRRLEAAGLFHYSDPDHKIEYSREELEAELEEGGFRVEGEFVPIVYDTPWAGLIDFIGGFSLAAYRRLSRWKREAVQQHPQESTGWQVMCRRQEQAR